MEDRASYKIAVIGAGNLGIRIAGEKRRGGGTLNLVVTVPHPISHNVYMYSGELALQGCTVHLYDRDDLKLQTVHSTISHQLQELKDRGVLSQGH